MTGLGLPAAVVLSPGQDADVTHAGAVRGDARPAVVTADKGYDSRARVRLILGRGAEAVIPSRKNSTAPRVIDAGRYKDRNLVERFRARAEPYRRADTRYEETARNILSFVHIISNPVAQIAPALSTRPSESGFYRKSTVRRPLAPRGRPR